MLSYIIETCLRLTVQQKISSNLSVHIYIAINKRIIFTRVPVPLCDINL